MKDAVLLQNCSVGIPLEPVLDQPSWGQPLPAANQRQLGFPPEITWMLRPDLTPWVPPGLEYLTKIDHLFVHQLEQQSQVLASWRPKNKYEIRNGDDQKIYFATEETDTFQRECCGHQRGFVMHITDNCEQEVIRITREFKCCSGCCWCAGCCNRCALEVSVETPVGQFAGRVIQKQSFLEQCYKITDSAEKTVLQIRGPACMCQDPCAKDLDFKVYSADLVCKVGQIRKECSSLNENLTSAHKFGVTFKMDLDVKMKAVLIGAVFLIDFAFFEQRNNNANQ